MSTLTRTNSHSKKPQYKDYVSFLENYKAGKKDDQSSVVTSDSGVSFSLSNSLNNSSNSVFSDVSDAGSKQGFKDHLEQFNNNRRSHSNNPDFRKPPQPKHAVKTELFIEIKNPAVPVNQNFATKVFEVQNIHNPQDASISVSNATKIFEKNSHLESQSIIKRTNSLQQKHSFSKQSSIGEISKKFEDSPQTKSFQKSPPKKAGSIVEASKMFEQTDGHKVDTLRRAKNFNAVPKPFQPSTLSKVNTENKVNPVTTKPAILSPKPVISVPQFPKFHVEPPKPYADSVDSAFSSLSISPSPPQSVSPPPFLSAPTSPPPPPPPLPPANFSSQVQINSYSRPSLDQNGMTNKKPSLNEVTSPKPVRNVAIGQKIPVYGNEVPQQNGGSINKNDPRVKKAVYGALRHMYGAYHDQANDYLATLPKNRVRKNNGLDNIINSIASQGGLEKLSGRANPNQELE